MRNLFLIIFTLITFTFYSQVEERNYHFDNYKIINNKNHFSGRNYKTIIICNSKDSIYKLKIHYSSDSKSNIAVLGDNNKKEMIRFIVDFDFKTIDDLSKLKNPVLTMNLPRYNSKVCLFDKNIEKIEYEKDSVKNSTIVHLTRFKDENFKKLINEEYYFFEKNDKIISKDTYSIKNYLQNSHNLQLDENQNLKKIYRLVRGKIAFETEFQEIINIDYNFNVKIENKNVKIYEHRK